MSSRTAQKAKAREQRLAAERERARLAHLRKVWLVGAGLAALSVAVVIVILAATGGGASEDAAPAAPAKTPSMLAGIPQDGSSLGSSRAPVVLTEFADLQCPFCRDYATQILPALIDEYVRPGKVRLELRLLRFIGPDSDRGARAAHEAAAQDRMWNFVDAFYRSQGTEGTGYADDDFIAGLAKDSGLRADALLQAIESGRHERAIARGEAEAQAAGLDSTPSFTISKGGRAAEVLPLDALTTEAFRRALDAEL